MKDRHGRVIDYIRISLTDRCNLRCRYCMPEKGVEKYSHIDILSYEDIKYLLAIISDLGIRKVRVTGGEPLVRRGALSFLKEITKEYNKLKFYLTTNLFTDSGNIKILNNINLCGINVGLSSINNATNKYITRTDNLDLVLRNIDLIRNDNIKTNTVMMKNINDGEIVDIIQFAHKRNFIPRFIEYMPSDRINIPKYFVSSETIINRLISHNYLSPDSLSFRNDKSATAELYNFIPDSKPIGFISSITREFCGNCSRIRITSTGYLKPCLFSRKEYYLLPLIRNKKSKELKTLISDIIYNKPFPFDRSIKSDMNTVGG